MPAPTVVTHYAIDGQTRQTFATAWVDPGDGGPLAGLSVDSKQLPSGVAPLAGAFTTTGQSSPFTPIPGRGFNASLLGSLGGSVFQLEKSFDSTTWVVVDANFIAGGPISRVYQEPESGVVYRFNCTTYGGSSVPYRFSQ